MSNNCLFFLIKSNINSVINKISQGLDHEEFTRPMNRKDIFYTGSIRNLKEFESEGKNLHAYRYFFEIEIYINKLFQRVNAIYSHCSSVTSCKQAQCCK